LASAYAGKGLYEVAAWGKSTKLGLINPNVSSGRELNMQTTIPTQTEIPRELQMNM
jgi:hypothetical protein